MQIIISRQVSACVMARAPSLLRHHPWQADDAEQHECDRWVCTAACGAIECVPLLLLSGSMCLTARRSGPVRLRAGKCSHLDSRSLHDCEPGSRQRRGLRLDRLGRRQLEPCHRPRGARLWDDKAGGLEVEARVRALAADMFPRSASLPWPAGQLKPNLARRSITMRSCLRPA